MNFLKLAIGFFVTGLVCVFMGANGIGGLSIETGKNLLFIYLILAALSFITDLAVNKR